MVKKSVQFESPYTGLTQKVTKFCITDLPARSTNPPSTTGCSRDSVQKGCAIFFYFLRKTQISFAQFLTKKIMKRLKKVYSLSIKILKVSLNPFWNLVMLFLTWRLWTTLYLRVWDCLDYFSLKVFNFLFVHFVTFALEKI